MFLLLVYTNAVHPNVYFALLYIFLLSKKG